MFGRAVRSSTRSAGGLLVVGTPGFEPWHLTAHLDEESRLSGVAELMPTLVRWSPPPDAPPHLRVGLSRLEAARRGETLFVVSSETAPVPLLERVSDARRVGATILALDTGDPELDAMAHETLVVPAPGDVPGGGRAEGAGVVDGAGTADGLTGAEWTARGGVMSFDTAQHLVSAAAGERDGSSARGVRGVRGLRDRIARLLDAVSGPSV